MKPEMVKGEKYMDSIMINAAIGCFGLFVGLIVCTVLGYRAGYRQCHKDIVKKYKIVKK